ncbi:hypothetical protein PR048_000548 [Dryococelus australis]|uniref:DUF4371 domain-containing protein n=1 Tax=Dryococelus australis TaxID=614101 RepID=A0ABQ9IHA8_9NEOP|nr:hypothetical protein PR048_000548 [Dryococelus australis]
MVCSSKLIQVLLEQKFSCARTKVEAIVTNVMLFLRLKIRKLFRVLLRYFDATQGVQVKLWELNSLPGEISDLISTCLNESLYNIIAKEKKTVALYADTTNCNCAGFNRKGGTNIFTKLKNYLGHELLNIVHNTIQATSDVLPVDAETIVSKITAISIFTLSDFCESVDKEYQMILGYSKTRWLALLPAVE